ncbi:MAG: hypothetical protein E7485_08745 [Ruminococcaceae bacterium]|nr:hypothetical protein [Oscillospiraceae bacterium]
MNKEYKTYYKEYNDKLSAKIILYTSALFRGSDACRAKYILSIANKTNKTSEKWNKAIKEIPSQQRGNSASFVDYEQYLVANGWQAATY